jgi:hypothetical protein
LGEGGIPGRLFWENQHWHSFAQPNNASVVRKFRRNGTLTKADNQNLSPEEWKAATDYALNLSDKMRASEQRSEETKSRQQFSEPVRNSVNNSEK